jgi:hypothetical protein
MHPQNKLAALQQHWQHLLLHYKVSAAAFEPLLQLQQLLHSPG